jgi:hypothetical protein
MRPDQLVVLALLASADPAVASEPFPATLEGHVIIPAETFIDAPADAPADLKTSGKFTTGRRVDATGSIEGKSFDRPTGVKYPFRGQPIQGHSGIKKMGDGAFWVITDNGFGAKANSPDSMLYLNQYRFDWDKGTAERLATIFLNDADKKVPFRIANEATDKRYLTGADFDIESFQPIGDKIWIGDEFGPYLLRVDRNGKVEAVFETMVDGKVARSPDHYAVTAPATPTATASFNVRRSKGFEGMAASSDGKFLYALLEGPMWDADKKDWEKTPDGKEYLRILEFDVAGEKWTGRHWKYVLEDNDLAIGDFNMIDATTGLVIERDNGEGTTDKACPAGEKRTDCFSNPAKFKRIYKIEMTDANANGPVSKIGYIDLMKIADPDKKARKPLTEGALAFPFWTIENVDVVDPQHIVVGNDNNLPFSSSREPNKADDNEFVLLRVEEFLKAR